MSKSYSFLLRIPSGVLLSAIAALAVAYSFDHTNMAIKTVLPLWFIVVLYAITRRYGAAAGVISSLVCALIFACVLFAPEGSWHIADQTARKNLFWMVVGGIALSYLFAPGKSRGREDRNRLH